MGDAGGGGASAGGARKIPAKDLAQQQMVPLVRAGLEVQTMREMQLKESGEAMKADTVHTRMLETYAAQAKLFVGRTPDGGAVTARTIRDGIGPALVTWTERQDVTHRGVQVAPPVQIPLPGITLDALCRFSGGKPVTGESLWRKFRAAKRVITTYEVGFAKAQAHGDWPSGFNVYDGIYAGFREQWERAERARFGPKAKSWVSHLCSCAVSCAAAAGGAGKTCPCLPAAFVFLRAQDAEHTSRTRACPWPLRNLSLRNLSDC